MNEIKQTIALLKLYKPQLTSQQFRTLCGQAKSGDTAGALKGLVKLTVKSGNTSSVSDSDSDPDSDSEDSETSDKFSV